MASVGVCLAGDCFDSGIFVAPRRIKTWPMSQRVRGLPQVVIPLNSRNGNPKEPNPIPCILIASTSYRVGERVVRYLYGQPTNISYDQSPRTRSEERRVGKEC